MDEETRRPNLHRVKDKSTCIFNDDLNRNLHNLRVTGAVIFRFSAKLSDRLALGAMAAILWILYEIELRFKGMKRCTDSPLREKWTDLGSWLELKFNQNN